MKLKQIISNIKNSDKKTSGSFSFSLIVSLVICILTTSIVVNLESNEVDVTFVDAMKPYIVSLFATVITFTITTISQSFIQVISMRAKVQDVSYKWTIITLGYAIAYMLLYFMYLIKYDCVFTILTIILTFVAIILSILSFSEAFSVEKPSLVGEK